MNNSNDDLQGMLTRQMDGEPMTRDEAISVWEDMHEAMAIIPNGSLLSCLYDRLSKECDKGKRCGVCGRYESEDCWSEC